MKPDWKANKDLVVGKGATVQEFFATVRNDQLAIDVAPWGEGHLRVNGREIAHINDAKDRRQAFRDLRRLPSATSRRRRSNPKAKGTIP